MLIIQACRMHKFDVAEAERCGYCKEGASSALGANLITRERGFSELAADEVFETVGKMDRPRFQRRG